MTYAFSGNGSAQGEADKTAVLEYKKELCGRYAPKSVNSVLSSLNALFVYMDRYDLKIKTLKYSAEYLPIRKRSLQRRNTKDC